MSAPATLYTLPVIDLTEEEDGPRAETPIASTAPSPPRVESRAQFGHIRPPAGPASPPPRPATRLPRYGHEIIDLEDGHNISLPPPLRNRPGREQAAQARGNSNDEVDDDVIFVSAHPRTDLGPPPDLPGNHSWNLFHSLRGTIAPNAVDPQGSLMRRTFGYPFASAQPQHIRPDQAVLRHRNNHLGHPVTPLIPPFRFEGPMFDYTNVAFDLGINNRPASASARASPVHEELPPVRAGFTRSPKEDDVLVCPNCEEELCVGASEEKKRVFVIKACGHVSFWLDGDSINED